MLFLACIPSISMDYLTDFYKGVDRVKIDEFVSKGQEETLFLDFKTVSDASLAKSEDKKNFAKALSGFANSSGGLIIWGVDARKDDRGIDCACGIKEIEPLSLFVSKLNEHTGQFVNPLVDGVMHKRIITLPDRGFAVTLIPASDSGPHMAKAGEDRYYKRSGDSFYRMEHFDIEDMFGRRKKPKLSLYTAIIQKGTLSGGSHGTRYRCSVIIGIENKGRGTAKYPYLALKINPPYIISSYGVDGNYNTGLPMLSQRYGSEKVLFGGDANVVIHPNSVIDITAVSIDITENQTTAQDLIIEAEMRAEDMNVIKETKTIKGSEIIQKILTRE
jgi:hypothetical protein